MSTGKAKTEEAEGEQHLQPAVIRPGFEITARYTDHAGQVQQAIHNHKSDRFVSIDSGAMHCWKFTGHVQARMVNMIRYPQGAYRFVTAITYSDSAKLVFCACLDGNLRIYKNDLTLKSVLPWDQTVVYDMHFLRSTNEIIASGLQGVKIYSTEVDDDAYARSVKDPEDVLAHIAHETNDWAYGQCQKIRVRMELRVPGVQRLAKAADSDKDGTGRHSAKTLWVYEGSNLVCTAVGASIYGFNFRSGKRILNWEKLHVQYISQFLFLPDRGQAITICEAPTALLWKLEGWKLKFVSKFGSFASIVVSLLRVPHCNAIITATKDGSVRMWSLETLQPQLSMKSAAGVTRLNFIDTSRCLLSHGRTVRLLSLRHCFPVLLMCDSEIATMQPTGQGSIFLWCEVWRELSTCDAVDDSAKVVDEVTGVLQVLIPPQLAVHSAQHYAWCPVSQSAYVLLQNYDIHVWRVESGSVKLSSVWKQHRRAKPRTLRLMSVATIPEAARNTMGLNLACPDVLLVGTADGDIALLDMQHGAMELCFCAHKLTALDHVVADEKHHRLLSVAGCNAKVWQFDGGVKSFGNIVLPAAGSCACNVGSVFIVGTVTGSVHMIDMKSGLLTLTLKSDIHTDHIRTLRPSASNQYVISSSKDGTVKAWDTSGKLVLSLVNTKRMQCASFLSNDDIIIGSGRQVEVIRQPFDISSRSLDIDLDLDSPEDKLPSFSKRALQLGLNGGTLHACEMPELDQHDMERRMLSYGKRFQRRDSTLHVTMQMHGMKTLGLREVELLGSDCTTPASGRRSHIDDIDDKGSVPGTTMKAGALVAQGARSVGSSFCQHALQSAQMAIAARPNAGSKSTAPVSEVEQALNPRLRRALRVVTDPTAFLEGQGQGAESTGRKKRRKRRKKKEKLKAMQVLEKKAQSDADVLAAVQQIRVQDAQYRSTMQRLVPNQKTMSMHTPAEAQEYEERSTKIRSSM